MLLSLNAKQIYFYKLDLIKINIFDQTLSCCYCYYILFEISNKISNNCCCFYSCFNQVLIKKKLIESRKNKLFDTLLWNMKASEMKFNIFFFNYIIVLVLVVVVVD